MTISIEQKRAVCNVSVSLAVLARIFTEAKEIMGLINFRTMSNFEYSEELVAHLTTEETARYLDRLHNPSTEELELRFQYLMSNLPEELQIYIANHVEDILDSCDPGLLS